MTNDKYNIPYRENDSIIGKPLQTNPKIQPERSGLLKKIVKRVIIPISIVGTIITGSQVEKIETLSLKYQGWYPSKTEGRNVIIFDENKTELREGKDPAYEIWNYSESLDLDTLEMQKKYNTQKGKKIRARYTFTEKGHSVAYERAMEMARGDYLVSMHGKDRLYVDDHGHVNKSTLSKLVEKMEYLFLEEKQQKCQEHM